MIGLLESAIKVALIFLVVFTFMPLLRKRPAALRHWVLSAALVCAALAPAISMVLPAWPLPVAITSPVSSGAPTSDVSGPTAPVATSPVSSESTRGGFAISGARLFQVWIAGVGISALILLVGVLRLSFLASRATPIVDGCWTECAAEISRDYAIRQPLLLQSHDASLLVTWGARRARILLPAGARDWTEDRIRLVLSHELAHARRGDWLVTLAAEVLRAVYWFNPLVWIACRRLRQESEQACDDVVLNRGVEGTEYATHLVDIVRELQQRRMWTPAPSIARASTLERRVKAMLDSRINRRPISRLACAATVLGLVMVTIPITGVAIAQAFATIGGSIVDPLNGALPDVTLVLTNTQTQAKLEVRSDRTGRYEFVGVPAGDYLLEAKLPGFAMLRGRLTVAGQNLQQDLKLAVGTLQETITVRASATRSDETAVPARSSDRPLAARPAPKCGTGGSPDGMPIGGNIRPPAKLLDVRPQYPPAAVRAGAQGTVVLEGRIGTDGSFDDLKVVSSPNADLSASAIDAVRQWQFEPTYLNCVAMPVQIGITVTFELEK